MSKEENQQMLNKFRNAIDTTIVNENGTSLEAIYAVASGFNMNWGIKNCGFGQYYFRYDEDLERMVIDTELMGPRFVELALKQMLKSAVYSDFEMIDEYSVEISLKDAILLIPEECAKEKFEVYHLSYDKGFSYHLIRIKEDELEGESERWKFIKFIFPEDMIDISEQDDIGTLNLVEAINKYSNGVELYYKVIKVKE